MRLETDEFNLCFERMPIRTIEILKEASCAKLRCRVKKLLLKEQEINNKRDCTWFHFWEESIASYFIIVTITVSCEIINLCFSATKKFFRCCGCWIASNQLKTVFVFEFFLFVFKKFSMFFNIEKHLFFGYIGNHPKEEE